MSKGDRPSNKVLVKVKKGVDKRKEIWYNKSVRKKHINCFRKGDFTMAMTSAQIMTKAKEMLYSKFSPEVWEQAIGKTGPDARDFLIEVPIDESGKTQEVFVTVKLTAHKCVQTEKTDAYDGFQAVKDYEDECATKAAEKAAMEKERASKLAEKESHQKSRRKPSEVKKEEGGE